MSILKFFGILLCSCMLLSCNSGSTTTSATQNSSSDPTVITLPDGTTITFPVSNIYIPFKQTVQIPITIVGGSLANGESLAISASISQSQASGSNVAAQENSSENIPVVTTSPASINVEPDTTYTIYLNVDDADGAVGSYSISLSAENMSTNTNVVYPKRIIAFILEHTCPTSDLETCRQTNCFAYVNPATASVNQANSVQYNAIAIMTYPETCFADIAKQTVWSSSAENIASIDASGKAAGLNIGDSIITAGSNTYNINYIWSESSELSVVPAVPYPGGYGNLSVTNVSDVTYSCTNGLNKPIYIMVNNGTGILGQVVHGWVWLTGYLIYVSDDDVPITVGSTGYGEVMVFSAGHKLSLNVRECQDTAPYYINFVYGGTVNGYTYPELTYPLQIKVID